MALPSFNTNDLVLTQVQSTWSTQLNPLLRNPSLQSIILTNVALISGTTVVNHLLGRKLIGWRIIRKRAAADIYDTQDSNQIPALTLVLVSNAAVVCDLEVF